MPVSQQMQRTLPPDRRPVSTKFARAVGSYLPKMTAAVFERYGFHSAEIMTSWETIAGADIARLARPQAIKWPRGDRSGDEDGGKGAVLIIACDPAFALEVSYRTADIADRINRYFGYRAVECVKVQQAPGLATMSPKPSTAVSSIPVMAAKAADLDDALANLGRSVGAARAR